MLVNNSILFLQTQGGNGINCQDIFPSILFSYSDTVPVWCQYKFLFPEHILFPFAQNSENWPVKAFVRRLREYLCRATPVGTLRLCFVVSCDDWPLYEMTWHHLYDKPGGLRIYSYLHPHGAETIVYIFSNVYTVNVSINNFIPNSPWTSYFPWDSSSFLSVQNLPWFFVWTILMNSLIFIP